MSPVVIPARIKKILIIKPSAFGDIIHSLPFLNAVKSTFPNARIDWVVAHGLHTFLEGHPMIDKLWVIKKDQWKKIGYLKSTLNEIFGLVKGLGKEKYDIAFDLSGILRSGLITLASKAYMKIGFEESDEGSPFFYTHKIKGGMDNHAIDRYLKLAGFIGCDTSSVNYPFAPFDNHSDICNILPPNYVVISPSAGKPANQWPAEKYGELASMLPLPSVVISSGADAAIAERVVKFSQGKALSIAGKTTLKGLMPIIKGARFFITNDTGPMHLAAALEVPVVAVFGPANPVRTGPYGSIHRVIQKKLPCSPCYAWQPCSHWRCMNELTVREVFDVVKEMTET
ncbi:Glycosyl transferase family 9 [Desulfamplus magnetovallimortis]|uniref:Glycosyl transferase family 9 n=1 Tax=Desulfamplus magnetovallimortis TaxID=1246637 RepID=A0A1W1H8I3_9BACT|nr:glycosyltransferase family 9 protein [Desulfamplus magnetovallimortis]SLM28744.1 Glycosyl transferase family 9 [Desulfamplus magnetovallimortis]